MQAVVEATGEKPMPVMKGAYEDMVIVSVETSASADVLFDAIRKRLNPEIDLARANFPDNLFVTETADEGVGTEHLVVTAFRAAN
jgi:hypothetical protein